jgi:hypothetical protein
MTIPKTATETAQLLEGIQHFLRHIVRDGDLAETQFRAQLDRDVVYALTWNGEDLLRKAQKRTLAKQVLESLESSEKTAGQKLEFLCAYATREAIQGARLINGTRGVSALSNQTRPAIIEFWGELAEALDVIPDLPES